MRPASPVSVALNHRTRLHERRRFDLHRVTIAFRKNFPCEDEIFSDKNITHRLVLYGFVVSAWRAREKAPARYREKISHPRASGWCDADNEWHASARSFYCESRGRSSCWYSHLHYYYSRLNPWRVIARAPNNKTRGDKFGAPAITIKTNQRPIAGQRGVRCWCGYAAGGPAVFHRSVLRESLRRGRWFRFPISSCVPARISRN